MADVTNAENGGGRRQQILEAALGLFAQAGVSSTTMRQLADAVGIKAASLYNHFGSKEEIVDAVVTLGINTPQRLWAYVESLGDVDRVELVRKAIEHWLHLGEENREIVLTFWREPKLLNPERQQRFVDATLEVTRFFENLFREGVRHGEFEVPNPALLAFNVWGLQLAWLGREGLLDPSLSIDEFAREQAEMILRQIAVVT